MLTKDFLFEIGCEELPAKGLQAFSEKLGQTLTQSLQDAQLSFKNYQCFATPRRLAVLIRQLTFTQPDYLVEKRGPALQAPETAKIGFARAAHIDPDVLIPENGYWIHRYQASGESTTTLLPRLISEALSKLGGTKWMRWGKNRLTFLRPVQWIVLLYGNTLIEGEILSKKADRFTYGHRFLHAKKIDLLEAQTYEEVLLEEGFVMADFSRRKAQIRTQIEKLAAESEAKAEIDDTLLEEVTGLVEWPVALLCEYAKNFLAVPKEALVSAMQQHQKCFPLTDQQGDLKPLFVTISNLKSRHPEKVIQGNERVMRARLSDADFFYQQDRKTLLRDHLPSLEKIIFQVKLGSMGDKVRRLEILSRVVAKQIHSDPEKAAWVARLCKCDLVTQMVGEFPELQGIMGSYYATLQGEASEAALAIREHYLPRFAGDALPKTGIGCALAIADRMDTLVGIFGIHQGPSSDKDPFGLRRAALGIIRLIIEKELFSFSLNVALAAAKTTYEAVLENTEVCSDVHQFILERLPAYYQEYAFKSDSLSAVLAVQKDNLYDLHQRIVAVHAFRQLPEATLLSEANKRVANILRKNADFLEHYETDKKKRIDQTLLLENAEKMLYESILKVQQEQSKNYTLWLETLAHLQEPIHIFFEQVMVDVPEERLKYNRLQLLATLRALFLSVADISLLQK